LTTDGLFFFLLSLFRMLEIVDTAGQEEYKTLRDIYFKESDGFILVYSITSPQSFVHAQVSDLFFSFLFSFSFFLFSGIHHFVRNLKTV
jgi:signal recognition particle receptor subunit beta